MQKEFSWLDYLVPFMFGIVFLVAFVAGSKGMHRGRWVFITIGISLFLGLTIPQIYAIMML